MGIRGKIILFFITTVSVLLMGFVYSLYVRQASSAEAQQIRSAAVQNLERAQRAELNLNKTITVWKNVLLHGQKTGDYHKCLNAFYENERRTTAALQVLRESLQDEPGLLRLVEQLIKSHQDAGCSFRQTIRVYLSVEKYRPSWATEDRARRD